MGFVYIKLWGVTIIEFLFTHWEFCMLSLKSWACLWSDWRDWLWENLFFNLNFLWFSFIQVLNLEAKVWMLKVKLFDYSAFKNGSNFHIKHIEFDIRFTSRKTSFLSIAGLNFKMVLSRGKRILSLWRLQKEFEYSCFAIDLIPLWDT